MATALLINISCVRIINTGCVKLIHLDILASTFTYINLYKKHTHTYIYIYIYIYQDIKKLLNHMMMSKKCICYEAFVHCTKKQEGVQDHPKQFLMNERSPQTNVYSALGQLRWGNCTIEALGHYIVYSALGQLNERGTGALHCLQRTGATAKERHWGTPLFTVHGGSCKREALGHSIVYIALGQLQERGAGALHCLQCTGATAGERRWGTPLFTVHWGNCTREALGHSNVYSALGQLQKRGAGALHCLQCTGATARERRWGTPMFAVHWGNCTREALGHSIVYREALGYSIFDSALGQLHERGAGALQCLQCTGATAKERRWGT